MDYKKRKDIFQPVMREIGYFRLHLAAEKGYRVDEIPGFIDFRLKNLRLQPEARKGFLIYSAGTAFS